MITKNNLKKTAIVGTLCFTVAFSNVSSVNLVSASTINTESTVTANNTSESSSLYLIHTTVDGKELYGFIDSTGAVVVKPTYTWARNFSSGVAVVNQDDKYLVINTKGEVLYTTTNYLNDFHNGLASFTDNTTYKSGYINPQGKVVLKAVYTYTGNFGKDNTAIVSKSGKYYRINKQGKILKSYSLTNKNYYYNITDDGYAIYTNPKTYLSGVVDLNGKTILKANYGEVTYLGNGLFGVKKKLAADEGYLVSIKPSALFNKSGKQLTSFKYYDLSVYNNNYASYTDSKYTYLIDTTGNIVSSFPKQEGRGTLTVQGDVVQADIDNTLSYLKLDGTVIWKNPTTTVLSSGVTVDSLKFKPNKYVTVYYPQLSGLSDATVQKQVNDKLVSLFTDNAKKVTDKDGLTIDDSFSVDQIKDLLIVSKTGYDYYFGAAHGTPFRLYYFIDAKTGAFYEFKDLFLKDSSYIKTLNNIVSKEIKKQIKDGTGYYFDSNGSYVTGNQFFYLNADTLTLYFDSTSIAPYAAGFPEFKVPFSSIDSLLNKDGAFWKSFHE